jgi:hypothetical protein
VQYPTLDAVIDRRAVVVSAPSSAELEAKLLPHLL